MGLEKDFIKREIQKLTILLESLIGSLNNTNPNSIDLEIEKINEALKTEFNITIEEIIELNDTDTILKFNNFHQDHIEKISELLIAFIKKVNQLEHQNTIKQKKLAHKAILLFNILDKQSKTFSIVRMHQKKELQQFL